MKRRNGFQCILTGLCLSLLLAVAVQASDQLVAGFGSDWVSVTEEDMLKETDLDEDGFIEEPGSEQESEIDELITEETGPVPMLREKYLDSWEALGAKWSVAIEDLKNGEVYAYQAKERMQSASVIKIFIMGAVYERIVFPKDEKTKIEYQESYEGELRSLLEQMITVSSNDAANRLTEILGKNDFSAGAAVVNDFCREHGFSQSHLGRRFMASNPTDDNYTSADDTRRFLEEVYHGKLVNEEASEKMLELLKGQTVRYKIPAGLPSGYGCANKTGEMPDGYGLGSIENDVAIVFAPPGDYILTVLSNEIGPRTSEADDTIRQISADVASWMRENASIIGGETAAG